ncbi:amidohydrolase [Arthrobacter sp. CAU 1506]|uniref:amidohydrolase n=1 Tax=Arthrobacter sp. CAU 1506 TaxID=2560052 RepID=UPI0010AB6384|nr:amidohydrolase [Arthrobacter sp. CAU 1506]TJY66174.1 amidohydrolase [Arthrobacter sp. CAU 1506]
MKEKQLALVNATILTMDEEASVVEAIAIDGDRIIARGNRDDVMSALATDALVYDLGGRTVLPGLIDVHTHVEFIALSRHFWHDVRGLDRSAILAEVRSRCEQLEKGQWLVFQGTFGQDLPSKDELDEAAPHNPVAVRWTMHKFVLNTAALTASGITVRTVPPVGVRIQKDETGRLNGVVEEGWDLVVAPEPEPGEFAEALEESLRSLFLSNGVTTVHEIGRSTAGIGALRSLAAQGCIPRIGLLLTAAPGHQPLISSSDFAFHGLGPGFGDDRMWLQGIKIFMDGGRDGAYRSGVVDQNAEQWGLLTRLYPTLVGELVRASEAGIQVCTHAIGDLAQEIAVSAVERVHEMHPQLEHRLRIEHFFNESRDTSRLERLVRAGGIAVPNPGFVFAEPDDPERRQPPGANKYALKTLRDIQGIVPGNSDTAGAQPFTTNPWFTMKCMLELKNKNGVPINDAERLDVTSALRGFTTDAAFATRQESDKGSLEIGKLADLIVIDKNPFDVSPEAFDTITTLATIIGGQFVYGSLDEYEEAQ